MYACIAVHIGGNLGDWLFELTDDDVCIVCARLLHTCAHTLTCCRNGSAVRLRMCLPPPPPSQSYTPFLHTHTVEHTHSLLKLPLCSQSHSVTPPPTILPLLQLSEALLVDQPREHPCHFSVCNFQPSGQQEQSYSMGLTRQCERDTWVGAILDTLAKQLLILHCEWKTFL